MDNSLIFVTGGAGFIGSNFIHRWLAEKSMRVVNLDKLTYAGNLANLESVAADPRYLFVQGDVGDRAVVAKLLKEKKPYAIVNFAAESHVDRSIHGPADFIQTNIVGTFTLLEESRAYWYGLSKADQERFRFVQISTDEVYGSLGSTDAAFSEETR